MIDRRAGHVHAALPIPAKIFAPRVRARADDRAKVETARVRGNKCFREKYESRALLRRFPTLAMAVPYEELSFRAYHFVYGLHSLPVTW